MEQITLRHHILVAENNPGDVRLIREALKDSPLDLELHIVGDGLSALDYLRRQKSYTAAPRPSLVVLDWNLPKKSGRDVLAAIKVDETLKRIPVIIFTTSDADTDRLIAYNLHANCFVTKPMDLEEFLEAIRSIEDFWLNTTNLPPAPAPASG